jgi:hypothetical protein
VLRTAWEGARVAATFDGYGTSYAYDMRGLVTSQASDDSERSKLGYDKRGLLYIGDDAVVGLAGCIATRWVGRWRRS